ncbi:MAG: FtsX-like permease family protein, partial [Acidobacteria bacterium]|nr:FtsX-like permease family protein [Acidobacteriota bacterium]
EKIARIEGVEAVIGSMWFGGVYKDPKNFFAQFAVNPDQLFAVYADIRLPEDQKQAFIQDRTGAIAGENLAERFGWKVGDRIHLQGVLFDFDPELTLRGIYSGGSDEATTLYFHWDYFNEGMKQVFGPEVDFTGFYVIRAKLADLVPSIAERIDEQFRNTSAPTKTESERAFVLGFLNMMGNIRFLITSISSVVIFTIILVAANTMAMSIRERVREIGILKALGFRRLQVLSLLMGESVLLATGGAALGVLAARFLYSSVNVGQVTGGMFQRFYVTPSTTALCLSIGLFVGIVSAGIPAWQAARRRVIDAIREVD